MKTYRKIPIVCFQLLLVLGLLLGTQAIVKADQFEEGVAAYKAGNYQKAFKFFKPLAEQGLAEAQYNLGLMYDDGQGVPQDDTEAVKWYRKAAGQGHAKAQNNLGVMYGKGKGVPQDYVQSHKWSNLSASRSQGKGHEESVHNRDLVEKRMTPAQVAEAQRLAREWKPKTWKELSPRNGF